MCCTSDFEVPGLTPACRLAAGGKQKPLLFRAGLMLCSCRIATACLDQDESITSLGDVSSSWLGIPACPFRGEVLGWLSCYFFPLFVNK